MHYIIEACYNGKVKTFLKKTKQKQIDTYNIFLAIWSMVNRQQVELIWNTITCS
jgi:hypothetical protein